METLMKPVRVLGSALMLSFLLGGGAAFAQVTGSGTGGKIPVWAGSGASTTLGDSPITENLGNGRIGIGTTSPGNVLHLFGTGLGYGLTIDGTNGPALQMRNSGTVVGYFAVNTVSGQYMSASPNDLVIRADVGNSILFGHCCSTPTLSITGDNVGVGGTPGMKLDVFGAASVSGALRRLVRIADSTAMAAGVGGGLDLRGKYDTNGDYTEFSNIKGVKVNGTSGDYGGRLVLSANNSTGTMVEVASVDSSGLAVTGSITATGSITGATVINAVYQDVAEWVPATTKMEPGTVVVLNRKHRNEVMPSSRPYDTAVAGVVSAQPGVVLGVGSDSKAQIATTGRVKVRVSAGAGAIEIGDLLVTSDKLGTAMKSEPVDLGGVQIHRPGTVIGKALEPLESGDGEILVLLSLQ